jgi:hypothetical protein
LCWQGSSNGVEKFSVRGDGLTTATTAEAGVSALVAHAANAAYTGTVLVAQTVHSSTNGAGFYLLRVLTDAAITPVEMFSVRGDGRTTASMAAEGESALVVHATHVAYTGDVLVAQTAMASDSGFWLFKVGSVAFWG